MEYFFTRIEEYWILKNPYLLRLSIELCKFITYFMCCMQIDVPQWFMDSKAFMLNFPHYGGDGTVPSILKSTKSSWCTRTNVSLILIQMTAHGEAVYSYYTLPSCIITKSHYCIIELVHEISHLNIELWLFIGHVVKSLGILYIFIYIVHVYRSNYFQSLHYSDWT